MQLSVSHTTRYEFSAPVVHGLQRLHLKPKDTHGQTILDWNTVLEGAKVEVEYDDHHHNNTLLISLEPGVSAVSVTCGGTVETSDKAGVIGLHAGHMPLWCFMRPTPLTRPGPKVRAIVAGLEAGRDNPLDLLHELSAAVGEAVKYEPGITSAETTAEQALTAGSGVCQDHAHVFISAGRLLNIPMRYIGGYLLMDDRVEQDAGHGWAEAHIAGLGWVSFDISNAICPDDRYVRVATGCDYKDAAPITGIAVGGGDIALNVRLSVEENRIGQGEFLEQQQQQQQQGQC